MYQVKLYNDHTDDKGIVIHSPYINDLKLSSGEISYVLGSIHSFNFTMNLSSPAWNKIKPYVSLIEVKDMLENKVIFEGRTLQPKSTMDSSGMFAKSIVCESVLAYLVDSSQRHAEIHDTTIEDFLQIIIDNHNAQVEPHKQFKLGNVTVKNTTDNVYRYLGYENTYETIKDKLTKRLGGYIQARREVDGLYLDYLEEVGEYKQSTPIKLAHNMQSIDYEIDPTEVITRLVPLGERIESEDEDDTDASQARLTIESVNGGTDYLDDDDLIAEFGIIEKSETWDDVTQPDRLKTNGLNFLRDQKAAITRFNVDSTNSYLLGKDIASFELGNYHDLINQVINLDEKVQIIEKKIDINQPQKSSLKIGDKFKTLTEYQKGMRDTRKEVTELKSTVQSQTKRIATIKEGLTTVDAALKSLNDAIGDADIPALEDAVENLNDAVENLTDAVGSIPDYELATIDEHGLMSKEDKYKLDLIQVLSSVNLDELKNKLSLISISNSIDLDKLYQDVEGLKNE